MSNYDIADRIACNTKQLSFSDDIHNDKDIPIYSFDRIARQFISGLVLGMLEQGYTEEQAKEWIASKDIRWYLDSHKLFEFARKAGSEIKYVPQ